MTKTILVATDGSADADRAVEIALHRAEREGGVLHALFVVDTRTYGEPALSSLELLIDSEEDHGHEVLDTIERRAAARGVPVVTRCCHGQPAAAIVEYADQADADLVVLGSREGGIRLGRNAMEVCATTSRRVVTV